MLQILRTNHPIVIIVIILYATLLHLHVFMLPSDWKPDNAGILSHLLYSVWNVNSLESKIAAVALVVFQSIYVSFFVNHFKLSKEYSYFPAAFYLLMMAFTRESDTLTPVLLGSTFLSVALLELYQVYKKDRVNGHIFNVGFWISVGSLFYLPIGIFLLFGYIGILILRSFHFKEWLVMLLGFFVPWFLTGTCFFAVDKFKGFLSIQFANNIGFLDFAFKPGFELYFRVAVLLLCLLIVLFGFRNYLYKKNIQTQKYINLLFYTLVVLSITPLFQNNVHLEHAIVFCMPFSIFISLSFLNIKTKPIAEFFFILLFIGALVWQYHAFLLNLIRGTS